MKGIKICLWLPNVTSGNKYDITSQFIEGYKSYDYEEPTYCFNTEYIKQTFFKIGRPSKQEKEILKGMNPQYTPDNSTFVPNKLFLPCNKIYSRDQGLIKIINTHFNKKEDFKIKYKHQSNSSRTYVLLESDLTSHNYHNIAHIFTSEQHTWEYELSEGEVLSFGNPNDIGLSFEHHL